MTLDVHLELLDSKNYYQTLEFGHGIVALSLVWLLGHVRDGSLTAKIVTLGQNSSNAMQASVALKNRFLIVRIYQKRSRTETILDLPERLLSTIIPLECLASQKLRKGENHVRVMWNDAIQSSLEN